MGIRGLALLLQPYRLTTDFDGHGHPGQSSSWSSSPSSSFGFQDHTNPSPTAPADDFGLGETCLTDPSSSLPRTRHAKAETATVTRIPVDATVKPVIAVLDGPALAYHAYHIALSTRTKLTATTTSPATRNTLEDIPSYSAINHVAIALLDALQDHGIHPAAVFFDGALPHAKRDVRWARLDANLGLLENCRRGKSVRPAPPFLVPSVIEALRASRYCGITSVISGEADTFCAAYAKRHQSLVLTSDSDLLVYDLGHASSVALWNDVELPGPSSSSSSEMGSRLRIASYDTAAIARRLDLLSLQPLAFALDEDPYRSLGRCVERAKQLQHDPSDAYNEFASQYAVDMAIPCIQESVNTRSSNSAGTIPTTDARTPLSSVLSNLDPRISEWVLAGPRLPSAQEYGYTRHASTPSPTLHFYLPFLIEDPTRSSAWSAVGAAHTRTLAYSLVRPSASTQEVLRRGSRIVETHIAHLDAERARHALVESVSLLARLNLSSGTVEGQSLSLVLRWRVFAIYVVYRHVLGEGKSPPPRHILKDLLQLYGQQHPVQQQQNQRDVDWAFVHSCAQIDAVMYSLRILNQCVHVCLAAMPKHEDVDLMRRCADALRGMPSIAGFCDGIHVGDVDEAAVDAAVDLLSEVLGVEPHVTELASHSDGAGYGTRHGSKKKKGKNKNKNKTTKERGQIHGGSKGSHVSSFDPSNRFGALMGAGDED